MTWGPLGNQKAASNRPIPDFLGSDQDSRSQQYPQQDRGGFPAQNAESVVPRAASGYGGHYRPLITLSLTRKSVFFLFTAFMLSITFAFVIGFAASFVLFSQDNKQDNKTPKSTHALSKLPDNATLTSKKKKIIIQQEENDLDDEELE